MKNVIFTKTNGIFSLNTGNFYHIYNRGNNGQDIFFENENYIFFS